MEEEPSRIPPGSQVSGSNDAEVDEIEEDNNEDEDEDDDSEEEENLSPLHSESSSTSSLLLPSFPSPPSQADHVLLYIHACSRGPPVPSIHPPSRPRPSHRRDLH